MTTDINTEDRQSPVDQHGTEGIYNNSSSNKHVTKYQPSHEGENRHDSATDNEKGPDPEVDDASTDPNIVDWDGPDDPANPRNWSTARKMLNVVFVSLSIYYA
jgi:hypothetical protein